MENFALTIIAITAIVSFMASVHTKYIFERHLFAWFSAFAAIKFGLIVTGFLDNETQRYTFDTVTGLLVIAFAVISLLRHWVPKVNALFTQEIRWHA